MAQYFHFFKRENVDRRLHMAKGHKTRILKPMINGEKIIQLSKIRLTALP
jgi:hypothetical protein